MDSAIERYNAYIMTVSELIGRFPAYRQPYGKCVLCVDFGTLSEEEDEKVTELRYGYSSWGETDPPGASSWESNIIGHAGDEKHYVIDQLDRNVSVDGETKGHNYMVAIYVD